MTWPWAIALLGSLLIIFSPILLTLVLDDLRDRGFRAPKDDDEELPAEVVCFECRRREHEEAG